MAKQFLRSLVHDPKYDKAVWEEELNLKGADVITMKLLKIGESFITDADPFIRIERIQND